MKLIPQEIVDKAANDYAVNSYGVPNISCSEDTFDNGEEDFKAGVEFAINHIYPKIEDIIIENQGLKLNQDLSIEFADWLVKNEYIPLQKLCWSKDSATYTSKTLFDKFLKERKL